METDKLGRVLVIDDSWVVLEKVRLALAGAGYDVRVAIDADAAVAGVPWAELAIVDFHMPAVDGGTLLPRLKAARSSTEPCQFYLYTSDAEVARTYQALGFDGGLLRKGDLDVLLPQVAAAFRTIKLKKLASSLRSTRKAGSSPPGK